MSWAGRRAKETYVAPIDRIEEPPRRGRGGLLLLGVAVAAAAGVGLAVTALPPLSDKQGPPPDDNQVSIVVDPAKPPPVPQSKGGPMEVLAPGMAEAAAPPPVVADAPLPEGAASPESALPRAGGPSFDCAKDGLTRGQQAVCSDPEISAMDRRMAQAYGEALAAGASAGELRAYQAEWRAAREQAAADSPDAVAQVYDARIRELDGYADAPSRR
jgi:uncharacterized protein YecT (DUF1311 family)